MTYQEMVESIMDSIIAESKKFKEGILTRSTASVYGDAYSIHIHEEISSLLGDSADEYFEEGNKYLPFIVELCEDGIFLEQILEWAVQRDSANVSTFEDTYNLICAFCRESVEDEE